MFKNRYVYPAILMSMLSSTAFGAVKPEVKFVKSIKGDLSILKEEESNDGGISTLHYWLNLETSTPEKGYITFKSYCGVDTDGLKKCEETQHVLGVNNSSKFELYEELAPWKYGRDYKCIRYFVTRNNTRLESNVGCPL